jgi:hypothetical protein
MESNEGKKVTDPFDEFFVGAWEPLPGPHPAEIIFLTPLPALPPPEPIVPRDPLAALPTDSVIIQSAAPVVIVGQTQPKPIPMDLEAATTIPYQPSSFTGRGSWFFLVPLVAIAYVFIPSDDNYDQNKMADSWLFYAVLRLPLVAFAWVGSFILLLRMPCGLVLRRKVVFLFVFAGAVFPAAMYAGIVHLGNGEYRRWTLAACLFGTLVITGIASLPLIGPEHRVFAMRATAMYTSLGGQMAFSLYFKDEIFQKAEPGWQRALICFGYPLGIRIIQVVTNTVRPSTHEALSVFVSQCLGSFPYRMLYPMVTDWAELGMIHAVEFTFKAGVYLLPLTPVGLQVIRSYRRCRGQSLDTSDVSQTLSAKFLFHQYLDTSNAIAAAAFFTIIWYLQLESYQLTWPLEDLHRLWYSYAGAVVFEIILALVFGTVLVRVAEGFEPFRHGTSALCNLEGPVALAVVSSYVMPLLYMQRFQLQ